MAPKLRLGRAVVACRLAGAAGRRALAVVGVFEEVDEVAHQFGRDRVDV